MSSIIINLNDTVAMSDSTLLEMAKIFDSCQPCVQEAATTCNDVKIVGVICATIILVTLIVCGVFCFLKCKESEEKNYERESKKLKEEKDYKRKQRADLIEKLLSVHQKRCDYYLIDKDGKRVDKDKNPMEVDKNAVEDYIKAIEKYIEGYQ